MSFKILAIDDEPNYTTALKFYLEAKGDYEVHLAASGQDGLEAAAKIKPDLIILDVMMPLMDGLEVLKRLKSDPALQTIPVLMMTAVETRQAKTEARELKADGYLNKPIEMEDLEARIKSIQAGRASAG